MSVEKDTRYQYVRINNLRRISGSPSNFKVNMSNSIELHKCKSFWLHSVSIPNVFYNIDTHNNTFIYSYNAIEYTLNINRGFYNVNELITALKNAIDSNITPDTVTITLEPLLYKLKFVFSNPLASLYGINDKPLSTLSPVLGLSSTVVNVDTVVLDNTPDLGGEKIIYLHSKDLNFANTSLSINRNVSSFVAIPVNVPYLSTIYYKSDGSEIEYFYLSGDRDLTNIEIKVRSSDGRLLELGDNHELIIVLKCFY